MQLNIKLKPVETFDITIGDVDHGNFKKESEWEGEGFMKLINDKGDTLVICDNRNIISKLFNGMTGNLGDDDFTVIKASPNLIPKEPEGE